VISCPNVNKQVIRRHYDLSTLFYRLLWGPHIHHGLWEHDESPRTAQLRLTTALAERARIEPEQCVYDIGCGMGGSSIHLARTLNCRVTGVTISPVQRFWAGVSSVLHGAGGRTSFLRADAETVALPEASADVVWSIECTEHLFDKPGFVKRAAGWLKPGGRVAFCAWLAGRDADVEPRRQAVLDVCEGFFCPSLGSMDDYCEWMTEAGLTVEVAEDWTDRVERTWEICEQRVRRSGVRWLARLIDRNTVMFLERFRTILEAYRTGAMQYGCLVASKPVAD
jgi:tocopherol O-methyltransferase